MNEPDKEILSKSARKRQAHKVEDLARQLVETPASAFDNLELDGQIEATLGRARGLSKGARKREIKHLAALLRNNEVQLEYLLKFQAGVGQEQLEENRHFHRLEDWREALCDAERREAVLQELRRELPTLDIAALEKLVNGYQTSGDKRRYRQIFTLMRRAAEVEGSQQ